METTKENIIKAYNVAKETGADSTCKVLEALYPDIDFTPKQTGCGKRGFPYILQGASHPSEGHQTGYLYSGRDMARRHAMASGG